MEFFLNFNGRWCLDRFEWFCLPVCIPSGSLPASLSLVFICDMLFLFETTVNFDLVIFIFVYLCVSMNVIFMCICCVCVGIVCMYCVRA